MRVDPRRTAQALVLAALVTHSARKYAAAATLALRDRERQRANEKAERSSKETFEDFIRRVRPDYKFYPHALVIIRVLQKVADGHLKRVMIFAPPRHGKSEIVSRLFPAYLQSINDRCHVGICAHTAALAHSLSRDARGYFLAGGGNLIQKGGALWTTGRHGETWAAGLAGPITGKGFHVGIIDDPVKEMKDAVNPLYQERQRDWWRNVFFTRQEPDAAIVIVNTRWADADLSGWLLEKERDEDDDPQHWHIVNMQAIRDSEDEQKFPKTCTVEPDLRKDGEALCADRYDVDKLNRYKRHMGPYGWSALYQQRPVARIGGYFKKSDFRYFSMTDAGFFKYQDGRVITPENIIARYTVVDPAGTEQKRSAYFSAITFSLTDEYDILVEDVFRERADTTKHQNIIEALFKKWKPFRMCVENKSFGLNVIQWAKRTGMPIYALDADRSKELRAETIANDYENGKVYHRAGAPWLTDLESELLSFPRGTYKDQADCMAYAGIMKQEVYLMYLASQRSEPHEHEID